MRSRVSLTIVGWAVVVLAGVTLSGCGGGGSKKRGNSVGVGLTIQVERKTLRVGDQLPLRVSLVEPRGTRYRISSIRWRVAENRPNKQGDSVGAIWFSDRFVARAPGRARISVKVRAELESVEATNWDENSQAYAAPEEAYCSGSVWLTVL